LAPGFKTDPKKFLPQFLQELYGISVDQAQGMIDHVTNSVKEVGLEYDLNKAIPANSFNAHRLSHFAKGKGVQEKIEERMFKAYFIEGKNIDDIPTLTKLANEIGLDTFEVKNILESSNFTEDVNRDLAEATLKGITSVPKYVFNSNSIISGGQDSNVYLETLEREFSIWQNDNRKNESEIPDRESCKIGEVC
ncbi:MAG TPA: DsbA family oxidoreductase, partial [Puia sp.]|nr:DsbA family oxidoreductase [Puia sp.]